MKNNDTGIYVHCEYIPPRKRKARVWGCADDTLEGALLRAKEWLAANGGRFVYGRATACSFYNVESDGKIHRMQSVSFFSVWQRLTPEQVAMINGKGA